MKLNEEKNYRHYIKVDENGLILWGWSDSSNADPPEGTICINENSTKDFRLFVDGEDNPPMREEDGISLYRWDGNQVLARSDEEIAEARMHVFRFAEYQNRYVLDSDGVAITNVIGALYTNDMGEERYDIDSYVLNEGETTLPYDYSNLPVKRNHAGETTGFIKNRWTGTVWVEAATPEDIAAWKAEHPAPEQPVPTPSALDVLGGQVAQLTLDGMQKNQLINTLGAELAQTKLDVMAMKQEGGV